MASNRDSINLRKYKIGDKVIGLRRGSKSHGTVGILVDAYVTINHNWRTYRNPAYVIETPEGKRLSFQVINHY